MIEMERRFLVDQRKLPKSWDSESKIEQGFLSVDPVVRVRMELRDGQLHPYCYLAVKGPGSISRQEFEYAISHDDARQLLALCGNRIVEKTRRRLGRWEVNFHHGRLDGLCLAEIEIERNLHDLELPDWVTREVTEDKAYTSAALSLGGIPSFG